MSQEKIHWRKFHPSEYLGAADFEPEERKILTVSNAGQESVKDNKGKSEECLVVRFKEAGAKPLICNVTNSKAIQSVSGSGYIQDWVGTKVELFTTQVSAFGEMVDAVRIKPTKPQTTKPELNPDHPAWKKVRDAVNSGYTRKQVQAKYTVSDENWELLTLDLKDAETEGAI